VHLKRGAAVAVGRSVAAGDPLGHSGNTGYSTRPHLHFDVYTAGSDGKPDTLPVRFEAEDPRGFEPVAGSFYPPQWGSGTPGSSGTPVAFASIESIV